MATPAPDPKQLLRAALDPNTGADPGPTQPMGASTGSAGALPPDRLAVDFPGLEFLEVLGEGGMGVVYKVRQKALDRVVALKVIGERVAGDPQFLERFLREARTLARLSHPSIVALHEFGHAGGRPYVLMEYVEGCNLRQVLQKGLLRPEQALAIVPPVCAALQYAHEQGVVHRDIKPENILLDREGRPKIADFGLARLVSESGGETLTRSGMAMGTPHYMAPEQVARPHEVDRRADIFALGVVLYEMLTGELPMGRFEPPSQRVQVDVRLDEIVLRALERDPVRRYQQASEMKSQVEDVAASPGAERNRLASHDAEGIVATCTVVCVLMIGTATGNAQFMFALGLTALGGMTAFTIWSRSRTPPGQRPRQPSVFHLVAAALAAFAIAVAAVALILSQ